MAVLPLNERLALLEQSTYGNKTAASSSKAKRGFRHVDPISLESKTQSGGGVTLEQFNKAISQSVSKKSENPHRQEVERLEANPNLMTKDREHYEQTLFFAEIYDKYPQYYALCTAIPNGGFRRKGERWRLCAEGQSAGWPDVQVMLPSQGFSGLFIEFKKPFECFKSLSDARRAVKPHQVATLRILLAQGYAAKVAYGANEAMQIFESYIAAESALDMDKLVLFFPSEALKPPISGEIIELNRNSFEILEKDEPLQKVRTAAEA